MGLVDLENRYRWLIKTEIVEEDEPSSFFVMFCFVLVA